MSLICAACGARNDGRATVCDGCAEPLSLAAGSLLSGRYEILDHIGEGGMGVIYRAHDRELDDIVALKLLRPQFSSRDLATRLKREMKLARRVTHANVCRLHEYGQHGALIFVCMELVSGADLRTIARPSGVPPEVARGLLLQVCLGLQAIHEVGIIHRDLKSANVMRDDRGVVKLMDFGIAKQTQGAPDDTNTGVIMGTPEFMSPEQARGEEIDFRTDIYAVGVIAYELLTGRVPFRGNTPLATLLLVTTEAPVLDGEIPEALRPIVERALAKHPQQRFATVRALSAALRAADLTATAHAAADISSARLASVGPPQADDSESGPLAALVTDGSPPSNEAVIADAVAGLADEDQLVRWRSAVALWSLGPAARSATAALRAATDDPSEEVADAAREALSSLEHPAADPEPPAGERDEILASDRLGRLIESLKSGDGIMRWQALLALAALGPAAAPAVDAIADALEDKDEQVACAAARALGQVGGVAAIAAPSLAAATRSGNAEGLRVAAASALGEIGAPGHAAVPALIDALAGTDACADAAAEALIAMGTRAVPALLEAITDSDVQVRWRSALLLTRIGFAPPSAASVS